jgi:hypothetical protein
MSRSKWALGIVVLSLAAALPLTAQTFSAGDDGWTTPSGATQVNLGNMSAVMSALGSPIVGGDTVYVQGSALNSSSLGSMDTIMARGAIASGSGTLTIIGLNLVSSSNIELENGEVFSMQLCLSDTASPTGSITLTQVNGDGGTFASSFEVTPKLVFTNVNNHSDVLTVDCASGGCGTISMSVSGAGYAQTGGPGNFNPNNEGIPIMPTGNVTVANCGGTHTVSLNGASGFYPGWTETSGGSYAARPLHRRAKSQPVNMIMAATGGTFNPSPINHGVAGSNHQVKPPQDCLPTQPSPPAGNALVPDAMSKPYCYKILQNQ